MTHESPVILFGELFFTHLPNESVSSNTFNRDFFFTIQVRACVYAHAYNIILYGSSSENPSLSSFSY